MRDMDELLDEVYSGQERMTRDDIYRRAVAADLPAEVIVALNALPEGEYAQDEVSESLAQLGETRVTGGGVPSIDLSDEDLLREMAELHRTRNQTLRHGSDQALARHDERSAELEGEYLRRFPHREIDPDRIREGARQRQTATVRPIEESQEVELAVNDEGPVPALAESGATGNPPFREPGAAAGPGPRGGARTGAEQPWDPEDLAVAEGHDPTPANVERARRELAQEGRAAIERTVP